MSAITKQKKQLKVAEVSASYLVDPQEVRHSRESRNQVSTFGEVTEPKIDQSGPAKQGEFVYVDISSVDNKLKRIVEPKILPVEKAPSRARQRLNKGDVLVSMTRPNLNAVAIVPPELDGAIGSTGFHVLRAREVEPSWLFYAVQTNDFVEAMCQLVKGALYPAVRPKGRDDQGKCNQFEIVETAHIASLLIIHHPAGGGARNLVSKISLGTGLLNK